MSNTFKLNTIGLRTEVLQSEYMLAFVQTQAESMAESDSHIKAFIGFDRAKAIVYPNTKEHPE